MFRNPRTLAIFSLAVASPAFAANTTVVFQNGLNGYTGQINALITSANPTAFDTTSATRVSIPVDGYDATTPANSPDAEGLIRFDNLFGVAAGQIPAGATIIDAKFRMVTHNAANSQSGGPFGVAALLAPFTPATTNYLSYDRSNGADAVGIGGNRGAWYQNGTATRHIAGIGVLAQLAPVTIEVTPFVSAWSRGTLANNGLVVGTGFGLSGTTDGWTFRSAANTTVADRPSLEVTYTTDPVTTRSFRNGVNGYEGTKMNELLRAADGSGGFLEFNTPGEFISQSFLDFETDDLTGQSALVKFNNVTNQVPAGATLLKAYLTITTGDLSNDARSPGVWSLQQLTQDWDDSKTFSQFGATGPSGTEVDSVEGMITGSEALFDVTTSIRAYLAGTANFGWILKSAGTENGWQVNYTGVEDIAARPQLVLMYSEAAALAGDYNRDGYVDAADYTVWADHFGQTGTGIAGDGNGDNVVDAADYTIWADNFGRGTPPASLTGAVPEPTALAFALPAAALLTRRRR